MDKEDKRRYFIIGSVYLEIVTTLFQQKLEEKYQDLSFRCLKDFLDRKAVIHILFHLRHRNAWCCTDKAHCNNHGSLPLNHPQWKQLYSENPGPGIHNCFCKYTAKSVKPADLDLSLCGLILYNCCNLGQFDQEAVNILRRNKNDYLSHNTTCGITRDEYGPLLDELTTNILQLDQTKEDELIRIQNRPLDDALCNKYSTILLDIHERLEKIETNLELSTCQIMDTVNRNRAELASKIDIETNLELKTCQIMDTVTELASKIDEALKNKGRLFNQRDTLDERGAMFSHVRRTPRKRKNTQIVVAASARKKVYRRKSTALSTHVPQMSTKFSSNQMDADIKPTSSTTMINTINKKERLYANAGLYTSENTFSATSMSTYTLLYSRVPVQRNSELANTETNQNLQDYSLDEHFVVSRTSSENEVQEWLKKRVGLTEEYIHNCPNFQYLDGKTLLKYLDCGAQEFKSDLKIPIGVGRRILFYLNHNNQILQILQYGMAKWNVDDVKKFVNEAVSVQNSDTEEICNFIEKEEIDGICFLSYDDAKEFERDLNTSCRLGVICKKVIARRDERMDEMKRSSTCTVPTVAHAVYADERMDIRDENISGTNAKRLEVDSTKQTTNCVIAKQWDSFIRNKLYLNMCSSRSNAKACNLKIIHSDWTNRNTLENKALFLILTDVCGNDYEDDERLRKSLWKRIRNNIHTWHSHFIKSDKDLFEGSQKEDALLFEKRPISLSKNKVKLRYLTEKKIEDLTDTSNVFLLISKNVFTETNECYSATINKPLPKKDVKPQYFSFTFESDRDYWIFDPDDCSGEFLLKAIPFKGCGNAQKDSMPTQNNSSDDCTHSENTIRPIDKPFPRDPEFSVYSETPKEKRTVYTNNSFLYPRTQIQRTFKCDSTEIQYSKGHRIATAEHDGSVSFQCYEFKFVPESLISKGTTPVSQFCIKEIIRFAGGCLNARKDGTIMFGIADSQGNINDKDGFVHGEVVGVPVHDIPGDFIPYLTDALRTAILKCFETYRARQAAMCIGNPVFVKVVTDISTIPRYVIEVDIEPSSAVCKDFIFKINRSKQITSKDIEKEFTLYVRENTGTVKKINLEETFFVNTELKSVIKKRLEDETQKTQRMISPPIETPMDRLRKYMCKGSNKLNKSTRFILIVNKPTDEQKENENWFRCLKFTEYIALQAIFDFDDKSNINGLCSNYGNTDKAILLDGDLFSEYSRNKQELNTKTVWIFSNGRSDIKPAKPCRRDIDWTNVYSSGIRDTVIFYSQKEIINKEKALVILLLFSNNFDGVVETFREAVMRFGWEHIVIIATEETLKRFMTECTGMEKEIKERSVSGKGMSWEHVNTTILDLTGNEDQENIFLTTSTGAYVPASEKLMETLIEFHIVSAKQCENKKFITSKDEEQFALELEQQFYRGEKVEWFNFYFESHVLKRHCFDRLKSSVGNILKQTSPTNERVKKTVAIAVIAHELGAGGTTLAHNMLWEFHKDYRCAIITKITEQTAQHVISVWQHKELNNAKPLLILIDELLQSDITLKDLIHQIQTENRSNPRQDGLICCFLICHRVNDVDESLDYFNFASSGHIVDVVEHLRQKLTYSEISWMVKKYEKFENKDAEYQPGYLFLYMNLRKGFNQKYIKNTIKQIFKHLHTESLEFELLEYTSLVSAYTPTSIERPKVFIPMECFKALIDSKNTKPKVWDKILSSTLKMFLIMEQMENAIEVQIRMTQHTLADAVLSQILENRNENLSSLTLRFLNSSILQCPYHERDTIIHFIKEMFVRRMKEEYNDDKTTQFSPLIDNIRNNESWENARDVLIKGYEKIKDSRIARTLARLCASNKDFQLGKSWAKKALNISIGKTAIRLCHHTFAVVLHELFKHETEQIQCVTPSDAVEHIAVVLDAFHHFIEAGRARSGSAEHVVCHSTGTLKTIINCLQFMIYKVQFSPDVDIIKFVTEETYSTRELEEWLKFRPQFLTFLSEGENAFAICQQYLCFNTTFYARDNISSFTAVSRKHRLYRLLQYRYPNLCIDFRSVFGVNTNKVPQSIMPDFPSVWHRRCLINLGGNSFMNICDILYQLKTKSKSFTSSDAVQKCIDIKSHLMKLSDKTSNDYANLVSVNIVLELLGEAAEDSMKVILEYCKQIFQMKRGNEDIAYFFICILFWPSNEINIEYDVNLFFESLRYLHHNQDDNKEISRHSKYMCLKEEMNVAQPIPQFFLTNGRGFSSLCHRFDICLKDNAESQFSDAIWEHVGRKNSLKRLKGYLKVHEGKYSIQIINEKSTSSEHIDIRTIRTEKTDCLADREVYFYVGFSIGGPIAYNVKLARQSYDDLAGHVHDPILIDDKVEAYLRESEEELQRQLKYIAELKSKFKIGSQLTEGDKELMKNEDNIATALEVKRNELFNDIE